MAVFVPRAHLCKQRARAFGQVGAKPDHQWQPGRSLDDYDGFIITSDPWKQGL
jgi:hypothetical protein